MKCLHTYAAAAAIVRRFSTIIGIALGALTVVACGDREGPTQLPEPRPVMALEFGEQPTSAIAGLALWNQLTVHARDTLGNVVSQFTGMITLTIGTNPGGGALSGPMTATAHQGAASFQNLRIDRAGHGYTLVASASGLSSGTSAAFDVGPPVGPTTNLITFSSTRPSDGGLGSLRSWISLVDVDGHGLASLPVSGLATSWSPDARKIAFYWHGDGSSWEIHVANADGSGVTRLTNDPADQLFHPAWSPDGTRIAFSGSRAGTNGVYVMNADGTGINMLTTATAVAFPAWSPDGSKIAFGDGRDGNEEIYVINADGSGITRLTNDPAFDRDPAWSPDGGRIAFASGRGGVLLDIYVMNADGSGVTRLNTGLAAYAPAWSPDGTRIAFHGASDYAPDQVFVMNADGSGVTLLTPPVIYGDGCQGSGSCVQWVNSHPAWRP